MRNVQEYSLFYERYSIFLFAQNCRKACAGSDKQVGWSFFLLMTIDDDLYIIGAVTKNDHFAQLTQIQ